MSTSTTAKRRRVTPPPTSTDSTKGALVAKTCTGPPAAMPEKTRVDERMFQVCRLVTLSGFTHLHHTLTSIQQVNFSFKQGVVAARKGADSCFNPDLLFLPDSMDSERKISFLNTCISPHLAKLSISRVSPDVLDTVATFKSLKHLHLYRINLTNISNSSNSSKPSAKPSDPWEASKPRSKRSETSSKPSDASDASDAPDASDSAQTGANLAIVAKSGEKGKNAEKGKKNEKDEKEDKDAKTSDPGNDALCEALKRLGPSVEHLTLCFFPMSLEFSHALCCLTSLKVLDLSHVWSHKQDDTDSKNTENKQKQRSNFCEADWVLISKHCKDLERLELDRIFGLTPRSLKSLKKGCPRLGYFKVSSCDEGGYEMDSDATVWRQVFSTFGSRLKGLTVWNESNVSISEFARVSPNMEELGLHGVWASSMAGFGYLKHLRRLELLGQRYVYDLSEIAWECECLETFAYTCEMPGKHSFSHDMGVFLVRPDEVGEDSEESQESREHLEVRQKCWKSLKRIETNDETCSRHMARLLVWERQEHNFEVWDHGNQCNIFCERYKKALKHWHKKCMCESDDCSEAELWSEMGKFVSKIEFDAQGKVGNISLWMPRKKLQMFAKRVGEQMQRMEGFKMEAEEKQKMQQIQTSLEEFDKEGRDVPGLSQLMDLIGEFMELVRAHEGNEMESKTCVEVLLAMCKIKEEMDGNMGKPPSLERAVKKGVRALEVMKMFGKEKYEQKIDELLKQHEMSGMEGFDFDAALKLTFEFQQEFEKGDEMIVELNDKEMELYDEFTECSDAIFEFFGQVCGIIDTEPQWDESGSESEKDSEKDSGEESDDVEEW